MVNYKIEVTRQYLRDLKLARKRGLDESKLNEVIRKLSSGEVHPPKKSRPYPLEQLSKLSRMSHLPGLASDLSAGRQITDTFSYTYGISFGSVLKDYILTDC